MAASPLRNPSTANDLEALKEENARLWKLYADLEREHGQLNVQHAAVTSKRASLAEANVSLRNEAAEKLSGLATRNAELEAQVASLRELVEDQHALLSQKSSVAQLDEQSLREAGARMDSSQRGGRHDRDKTISDLQEALDVSRSTVLELRREVAALKAQQSTFPSADVSHSAGEGEGGALKQMRRENERLAEKFRRAVQMTRDSHLELETLKQARADLIDLLQALGDAEQDTVHVQQLRKKYGLEYFEEQADVDVEAGEWDQLLQRAARLDTRQKHQQRRTVEAVRALQQRILQTPAPSEEERQTVLGALQALLYQGSQRDAALLVAVDQLLVHDLELTSLRRQRKQTEGNLNLLLARFGDALAFDTQGRGTLQPAPALLSSRVAHLEAQNAKLKRKNRALQDHLSHLQASAQFI
eukprot:m.77143 g.77143  ORF g.77143 m.77143 type:complete len:416 (+) comp17268_c0_seq2:47-1294(+)